MKDNSLSKQTQFEWIINSKVKHEQEHSWWRGTINKQLSARSSISSKWWWWEEKKKKKNVPNK